jgi:pyruvate/2-oxoglutarate dehydrogenase complex dihydrolipoamide dehydrogenase (E3) component
MLDIAERVTDHDEVLHSHVRPADWPNPTPAARYDLVVVGGGTAGLVAAAGGAGLGARVALVERDRLGGDCLNVGCVPSKAVIRAARAWSDARRAAERFSGPVAEGPGDFAGAMERMRRLRAAIGEHDGAARFRSLGVDVFFGQGRFAAGDRLLVGDHELRFRRALVATGARAGAPPIPGLAEAGYLTNETIFDLRQRPAALAVLGAGPIGAELGQAFARFGSRVTVLDVAAQVLPREDPDAATIVQQALLEDGVELRLGVTVEAVERRGARRVLRVRSQAGETSALVVDEILVATGRVPNLEGLDLEAAGVRSGRQGIEVDDRLRTSNRRIFAAGDVASRFQFTHTADAQARIVLQNAFFLGRKRNSALVVPWVTYTRPEVAHVGLYEAEATQRGLAVETLTVPLGDVDRARLDGETAGFLRLHLERGGARIVGATLVAEHAGELISEITAAMTTGVGLDALGGVIHPYPTQAEVIKKAADAWRRRKLTPRVRNLFHRWFQLTRLLP